MNLFIRWALIGVVLSLASEVVSAQINRDAIGWLDNHKYSDRSDNKLKKLAEKGDANAAFQWAYVSTDQAEKRRWLHSAADLGYSDPSGEAMIGLIYINVDETEALFWLKRSVEHGSPSGMTTLARYYEQHKSAPGAAADKLALHRQAAERGDVSSIIAVGQAYLTGNEVAKDTAQADIWLSKADTGNAEVESQIGMAYLAGGDVRHALEYLRKASAQPVIMHEPFRYPRSDGQQYALQHLGEIYRDGNGVPTDSELARLCFDAKTELYDTQHALELADQAQMRASADAAHQANRNAGKGVLAGILAEIGNRTADSPNAIETAKNQQLSNLNAAATATQRARAQRALAAAASAEVVNDNDAVRQQQAKLRPLQQEKETNSAAGSARQSQQQSRTISSSNQPPAKNTGLCPNGKYMDEASKCDCRAHSASTYACFNVAQTASVPALSYQSPALADHPTSSSGTVSKSPTICQSSGSSGPYLPVVPGTMVSTCIPASCQDMGYSVHLESR